jgi:hypothetical protein
MAENQLVNPASLIEQFNSIQNQFGGQSNVVNKGKEMAGNMLLSLGAPFFGERLAQNIGKPFYDSLKEIANSGGLSDVLNLAKTKFENEVLPAAKKALTDHIGSYVPELKGVDLENVSFNDLRTAVQNGITNRIKSALPKEIADALPSNMSNIDNVLSGVRQLGAAQALQVAKNTLPPEVYTQLESNQDLINDPSKIAGFMKSSIADAQSRVIDIAKTTQADVEQRLSGLKQELIDKANDTIQPLKDNITKLQSARDTLKSGYATAKTQITEQFNAAQKRLDDFQRTNPGATAEDLAPFKKDIADILAKVRSTKADFIKNNNDLGSQLDGAQSMLQSNTDLLQSKLSGLRNGLTARVNNLAEQAQQTANDAIETVRQTAAPIVETIPTELPTVAPEALVSAAASMTPYISPIADEAPASLISRFKSWAAPKVRQITEPVTRRAEDVAQQADGFRPRLMSPDEPMNFQFSERALTFRNPALASYYGTESTPAELLIRDTPSRQITSRTRVPRRPTEEQPSIQAEPTQPPQLDQLAPMRELMARQAQATPAQPSTAPTQTEPIPTQLAEPTPTAASLAPEPTPTVATADIGEELATKTESLIQKGTSIANKVTEGLDTAAAATEEVPVLDIVMNVAGLLGSIFGGKALMGDADKETTPIVSGSSYEPNL